MLVSLETRTHLPQKIYCFSNSHAPYSSFLGLFLLVLCYTNNILWSRGFFFFHATGFIFLIFSFAYYIYVEYLTISHQFRVSTFFLVFLVCKSLCIYVSNFRITLIYDSDQELSFSKTRGYLV
jgi:hypothetical protein